VPEREVSIDPPVAGFAVSPFIVFKESFVVVPSLLLLQATTVNAIARITKSFFIFISVLIN
jgi:hypothetical protein